jgi:hypothetical protein
MNNSANERLARMGKAMDAAADTALRIADDARDAVTRASAESAATVLRHLATAIDAATVAECPGMLDMLARDATATVFNKAFREAMELRLAEAVPVLSFSDEQEGE